MNLCRFEQVSHLFSDIFPENRSISFVFCNISGSISASSVDSLIFQQHSGLERRFVEIYPILTMSRPIGLEKPDRCPDAAHVAPDILCFHKHSGLERRFVEIYSTLTMSRPIGLAKPDPCPDTSHLTPDTLCFHKHSGLERRVVSEAGGGHGGQLGRGHQHTPECLLWRLTHLARFVKTAKCPKAELIGVDLSEAPTDVFQRDIEIDGALKEHLPNRRPVPAPRGHSTSAARLSVVELTARSNFRVGRPAGAVWIAKRRAMMQDLFLLESHSRWEFSGGRAKCRPRGLNVC